MDKNTLSNYGWIVIAVLVLSVMIALATPFGEYIKAGVESTTAGLFDTSENALNVVGMSAKEKDVLTGNKLAVFGTSISMSENIYVTNSWAELVSNKYTMSLNNYAVGGDNAIQTLAHYENAKAELSNYTKDDFVLIEGFFNNISGVPLGNLTPIGTTTFDTTTFMGALEEILYQYQESGCKAQIGVILTHFSTSGRADPPTETTIKYNQLWDAAVSVCEKYDIPYLDLRAEDYPLKSDGVHITQEGQQMMADAVEAWMKTL